jgi:hypothetical protein
MLRPSDLAQYADATSQQPIMTTSNCEENNIRQFCGTAVDRACTYGLVSI